MTTRLSSSQLQTLKSAITAETDPTFVGYRTSGSVGLMAQWYNQPHATAKAWHTAAQWYDIANAIDWSKYTPATANIPTDTAGTNKLLAILIKATVQQNMIIAMQSGVDATDGGTIDGLLDTVVQVPAGAAGANVNPGGTGGVNVANVLARTALKGEFVFGGTDVVKGTVTAKILNLPGELYDQDIIDALSA